jgi:hypothetical protein
MTDSVSKNVKVENDSSRLAGSEPGLSVLERYAVKVARTVLRGGGDGNVASLPDPSLLLRRLVPRKVDRKEDPQEVGYEIAEKANARL